MLKEVRRVVDRYPGNPVLITEADEPNVEELAKMYGNGDEVQLPMDFQIADVNELSAPRFRELFNQIENNTAHGQPEYFFSNHDQPRQWDRYGDGEHNDQIAKLMAVLLLAPRGTPQMYYGEELGMRTTDPARIEDVHDPIGKLGWPKEKGRDGERTPMQWDATFQGRVYDGVCALAAGSGERAKGQRGGGKQGSGLDFERIQAAAGAAQDRPGAARRHVRGGERRRSACVCVFAQKRRGDGAGGAEHERQGAGP